MRKITFTFAIAALCLALVKVSVAEEQTLSLGLAIDENYFEIWAFGGSYPKIFYKEDGENLWILNKKSKEDTGRVERRSAYDELGNSLVKIHKRYKDDPSIDWIMIVPDSSVLFSKTGEDKIIKAAEKAVQAGFVDASIITILLDDVKLTEEKEKSSEQLEKILKKVPGMKLRIINIDMRGGKYNVYEK